MSLNDCILYAVYAVLLLGNIGVWSAIYRDSLRNMSERQKNKQPCSICGAYRQYGNDHNGGVND